MEGDIMKNLNERIAEFSSHLQALTAPEIFPTVEEAVKKNDKKSLLEICKKANIPKTYSNSVVSLLLSIDVAQPKWPDFF